METCFDTLRPRQNGRHFADDIFKCILLNENVSIAIKISLKFVPKGPINNIPALVKIMAWRRSGDKSLSEPMTVSLPTHICVTRPQWVNGYAWQWHNECTAYSIEEQNILSQLKCNNTLKIVYTHRYTEIKENKCIYIYILNIYFCA